MATSQRLQQHQLHQQLLPDVLTAQTVPVPDAGTYIDTKSLWMQQQPLTQTLSYRVHWTTRKCILCRMRFKAKPVRRSVIAKKANESHAYVQRLEGVSSSYFSISLRLSGNNVTLSAGCGHGHE
jgi:hypothetical protein